MDEEREFEPPTRIDDANAEDAEFDAPTRVRPESAPDDATKLDVSIQDPALVSGARARADTLMDATRPEVGPVPTKEKAARTIVQVSPGPGRPSAPTLVKPLVAAPPDEPNTIFLREQLTPSPRPIEPDSAAPAKAAEADGPTRSGVMIGVAAAAGLGLALGVVSVVVWVSEDDPEPAQVQTVDPDAVQPDGPELAPLAEAPPLADAADLAIRGRYEEAARAYAALAREHPDRAELAAMARVLRAKAGDR